MTKRNYRPTRRAALKAGALGGLMGAAARTSFAKAPSWMQGGGDKLLTIFLRGGYDGTNAIIPSGDPDYNTTLRPSLFIPAANRIPIPGSTFSDLNPALARLAPMAAAGRAVFAHAVGNPARTGSHFEDQRTWETAITGCTPGPTDEEEGWVTRAVSSVFPGPFRAASVSSGMQQLFRTRVSPAGGFNPDRILPHVKAVRNFPADTALRYTMNTNPALAGLDGKLRGSTGATPFGLRALFNGGSQPLHVKDRFSRAVGEAMLESEARVSGFGPYFPAGGAVYPFGSTNPNAAQRAPFPTPAAAGLLAATPQIRRFFLNVRDAMMLLRNIPEVRVVGIELGGFDTHSGQGSVDANGQPIGRLAELLDALSFALEQIDLETQAGVFGSNSLTTMVFSEFGRTSAENSTAGTDHGGASTLIITGDGVQGDGTNPCHNDGAGYSGVLSANDTNFGCNVGTPSGAPRYVGLQTDFRAVFAEACRDILGASNQQIDTIIPGYSSLGLTELDCFA